MDHEREKKKLEAQHEVAKARLAKEDEKRKALKRQLMATTARLEDRAEKWHRYALAHDDRMLGFTGEQAIARAYLRALPFDEYVEAVRKESNDGRMSLAKKLHFAVQPRKSRRLSAASFGAGLVCGNCTACAGSSAP
jgi:hypothetical protein